MNAKLNAASIKGELGAGAAVINDYRIEAEEIENGHRLTITRGSETQTMDIMDGVQGQKGDKGDKGEKGDTGAQGVQGIQGIQGIQGEKGDKGEKGDTGAQGEPGKDAPQESVLYTAQELTSDQQAQARANIAAAGVEAVETALGGKLTEPAEGMAVGKYFRVAALDENGHAVLEAVDANTVGVQDVQIAGESIVADGVANVPLGNSARYGFLKPIISYGITTWGDGQLGLTRSEAKYIDSRSKNDIRAVSLGFLDYAVKAAMCDGKGTAWNTDEQAAARERMGAADSETVNELKDDLADKLPKSPANWEPWTTDEQAAARGKMSVHAYHWQKIADVTITEEVNAVTLSSPEMLQCEEFVVRVILPKSTTGENVSLDRAYIRLYGTGATNNVSAFRFSTTNVNAYVTTYQVARILLIDNYIFAYGTEGAYGSATVVTNSTILIGDRYLNRNVSSISVTLNDAIKSYQVGTQFLVYGRVKT